MSANTQKCTRTLSVDRWVYSVAGLFLGGYYALAHIDDLGITHVLSVVNGPISRNMCIEILGSDSEDVSAAGRPLVRHHVSVILCQMPNPCWHSWQQHSQHYSCSLRDWSTSEAVRSSSLVDRHPSATGGSAGCGVIQLADPPARLHRLHHKGTSWRRQGAGALCSWRVTLHDGARGPISNPACISAAFWSRTRQSPEGHLRLQRYLVPCPASSVMTASIAYCVSSINIQTAGGHGICHGGGGHER